MTNEEAIKQLEWVKKRMRDITYSPESFEAINLAIEALRQMDSCPVFSERCYKYEEADCGYPTAKHSWVYNKIKEADNESK